MKIKTVLATTALVLAFGAAPSLASAPQSDSLLSASPDSCIAQNLGDWNACNVGNSSRGELPYKSVTESPNACIERNHGDWNACNVRDSR
jgi:hypothetical protein